MMGSSIGGTRSGKEPLRLKICQYKLPKLKKNNEKRRQNVQELCDKYKR